MKMERFVITTLCVLVIFIASYLQIPSKPTQKPTIQKASIAPVSLRIKGELQDYLDKSSRRFPTSPVDKLIFFNPIEITPKRILNQILIDIPYEKISKASPTVLISFLSTYVGLVQRFNCDNHSTILNKGISITNFLFTREQSGLNFPIPAITWSGRKLSVDAGFETRGEDCIGLTSGAPLKVEPIGDPSSRLLKVFENQSPRSFGTAWPLTNGLIVTNEHVVRGATKIFIVRPDREFVEAQVLVSDAFEDIALLRISEHTFLPSSLRVDASEAGLGKQVFTMGYPWTSGRPLNTLPQVQLTQGIISSIPEDGRHYQLSLPVQLGNSGGPLFDITGKVVGIVSAKIVESTGGDKPEMVAIAVKANRLSILTEYLSTSELIPPLVAKDSEKDLDSIAAKIRDSILLIFTI